MGQCIKINENQFLVDDENRIYINGQEIVDGERQGRLGIFPFFVGYITGGITMAILMKIFDFILL